MALRQRQLFNGLLSRSLLLPFALAATAALGQQPVPEILPLREPTAQDREIAVQQQAEIALARQEALGSARRPVTLELVVHHRRGEQAYFFNSQLETFQADFSDPEKLTQFYQELNLVKGDIPKVPLGSHRLICTCTGVPYTWRDRITVVFTDFSLHWAP